MEAIPVLGFGTYQVTKTDITKILPIVLQHGYVHLDCAHLYKNQKNIGNVLSQEDFKNIRSKIWITSKIDLFSIADRKVETCMAQILSDLNTPYLDLVLLHAPSTPENNLAAWMVLEQFKKMGKIKNIGVSNYKESDLDALLQETKSIPYTNQLEVTPFITRDKLINYCNEKNILISAHSPLTKGYKLNNPHLVDIAKKYNSTPAQILIQWSKQKKYIVLPRSKQPEHIKENFNINFTISDSDIKSLDNLNENYATHSKYL
jgi:diketogulonate reductase-like aldo/keto reductase